MDNCECAMWFVGIMVAVFGSLISFFGIYLPYRENKKVQEMYKVFKKDKIDTEERLNTNERIFKEYLDKYPHPSDKTRLSELGMSHLVADERYKI